MNKFKQILVACFCVFLFTVSCDKEIISDSATPSVIQARANAAARLRTDINKVFLNYDFAKHKIVPLWDLAVVFNNKKSIEVPYSIDGKLIVPSVSKTLKGRQRLLLTLNGSKVSVMNMQYIPDVTFKGKITEISAENFMAKQFSGKIIFQSLGEEKLYIWDLEKGKINGKKQGYTGKRRSLRLCGQVPIQLCITTDFYFLDYTGEWVYSYSDEYCWNEWVEDPNCGGDDGGGGEGGGGDPNDCTTNPALPWCGNGGGGDPCGSSNGRANPCDFGSATSEWGSDYTYSIKDACGGLSGMWLRQFAESKEMLGFLTSSGQVIIAPSLGNTFDNSIISNLYKNENGNTIMNFYNDGGTWKVELYSSTGVVGNYVITGMVHTHPYPGPGLNNNPSPLDLGVASSYPQLNHYVLTTTGKIHYDQNGAISNDGRSCY